MPAVSMSAMKQDTGDDVSSLDDVRRQSPSPAPCYLQQRAADDCHTPATPRRDVIGDTLSRDDSSWPRPTSGALTSQSAETTQSRQTLVDVGLPSKLVHTSAAAAASSSALVSSPETGWRAISGSSVGGLWERPIAQTSVSSPADGEPADVSLVAASPTVGHTPPQTSDSGSSSCDPLATLMRLYGTFSDEGRLSSPVRQLNNLENSPALITSLPVVRELATQAGTSVPVVNNDDYIMRELNKADDDEDGPSKSYVCHVCQYIGTSRSMYLNHMSEHFKHRCTLCGYMTSYAGRLKRHLEDCHTADDDRPVATPRKPTLKRCRKCGFESTNLKLFYDHVRTHIRPERILECPTASCPFVTEYRHHLELHLRNHLNSRPIRCPICPYRCAVSSMLASHLKSHTKVHRFRCSVCRFSSKFSNALKRHLLEKGHGRGYVLNPDGSIPEGGAVPFEPGSPTTRLRQKVTATTKTASATTATATSEALRKPTRSVDVTSEVALVTGTDIKASIWTPPVATSTDLHGADARMANWRSVATGEEQLVKCSPSVVGTSPVTVAQPPLPPLPPLPALMTSTSASLRARPLYVCAVCGLDAGGYVGLAQHMMTSHYSVMTSGSERQAPAAATMPFKRRWPGDNDEPGITSWTPPPKLPTPQLNNPARRPVSRPDDKREFLQPGFQASSTFHQPSPPVGWGSYRSVPAVSSALSSLSELRAELDAVRSLDGRSRARAEETFRTPDHDLQRDNRVKSAKFDVVDSPRWTDAPPRNVADGNTSPHWQKTQPSNYYVEHAPAPMSVTSGLPLDLSAKTSTLRCDQLLASVQSEVKRSRRKGKAFKVDADRLNSGSRDEDLNDSESVGRYSSATETKVSWRTSEIPDTATSERVRSSGGNMLAGRGLHFTGYRDIPLPSQARSGQSQWSGLGRDGSDVTASRQTTPVSVEAPGTSSTQYHECRHCGLGFRDGELYAMHMDFHGRPDPFTCNFCGTSTGNQVEFFLHVAHAPHNVRPVYVV